MTSLIKVQLISTLLSPFEKAVIKSSIRELRIMTGFNRESRLESLALNFDLKKSIDLQNVHQGTYCKLWVVLGLLQSKLRSGHFVSLVRLTPDHSWILFDPFARISTFLRVGASKWTLV